MTPSLPKNYTTININSISNDNPKICKKCYQHPKVDDFRCQNCNDKEAARINKFDAERIAQKYGETDSEKIASIEQWVKRNNAEKQDRVKHYKQLLANKSFDDTTIIEYFLKCFKQYKSYDRVLYCFNGTYWVNGSNQLLIKDIDQMYRELCNIIQDTYKDEDLIKYLKKIICLRSIKYKKILIEGIIGYVQVDRDLWDLNDDLVGFQNGVYDLQAEVFRPGRYEDYISMVIEYDYAESTKDELKAAKGYFNKIMPEKEERDILLLVISTILSGRHLEKFIVCTGVGRNGKDTTFTYLLKVVMGPYYYQCNPTAITQKIKSDQNVSIANFDKKRIVVTSEPEADDTVKTSMIKALTGSSETAMRTLYSNKTEVHLNQTLFMLCNDKPVLDKCEQAILDRLIVIPFRCTFKSMEYIKENGLTVGENHIYVANEKFKSAAFIEQYKLPVLNLLLCYYRKFKRDGYLIQKIPESIKLLNKSYLEESDEFMCWFNSEYEKTIEKDEYNNPRYLSLTDVFVNYAASEFYDNLTKKEKRANSKGKFIERVSNHVLLKLFYKEEYRPYEAKIRIKKRNVLINYKLRTTANEA